MKFNSFEEARSWLNIYISRIVIYLVDQQNAQSMYFINFNITEDPNWQRFQPEPEPIVEEQLDSRKFKPVFKIEKITTFGEVFIKFEEPMEIKGGMFYKEIEDELMKVYV